MGETRKCTYCGEPIYIRSKDSHKVFCSQVCKDKVMGKLLKTCSVCGKEFTTSLSYKKYCSRTCLLKMGRERAKDIIQTLPRFKVFQRDDFRCCYCGKTSYRDYSLLHVDHLYPKSKGGSDCFDNLITSCQECNLSKHDKILSENILKELQDEIERRNIAKNINPKTKLKEYDDLVNI